MSLEEVEDILKQCGKEKRDSVLTKIRIKLKREIELTNWYKDGKHLSINEYQKYACRASRISKNTGKKVTVSDYLLQLGYVNKLGRRGRPRKDWVK